MFEKVNPSHPDKVADRIAGAIVDLCYAKSKNPKVACEVLIGHGECNIQVETSEQISAEDIEAIVSRIAGEGIETRALIVPQDIHLADNQQGSVRCGDNGIFKGCAPTHEQRLLTAIATSIYDKYPTDGKYLIKTLIERNMDKSIFKERGSVNITICQSHATEGEIRKVIMDFWEKHWPTDYGEYLKGYPNPGPLYGLTINPLGEWTGGINTDCGATNRKLGSDMGDGVTGGGLHGKDLSKADVSVNIWCYLESIRTGHEVTACCSIGDESVKVWSSESNAESHSSIAESLQSSPIGNGIPYKDIVEQARLYIHTIGGFEKFAEWGLVRPLATTLRVSESGHKLA